MTPSQLSEPPSPAGHQSEGLSLSCPVRVVTRVFGQAKGHLPHGHGAPLLCGRVHVFSDGHDAPLRESEYEEICVVTAGSAVHRTPVDCSPVDKGAVWVAAKGASYGLSEVEGLYVVSCAYLGQWLCQDTKELWALGDLAPVFLGSALYAGEAPGTVHRGVVGPEEFDACFAEFQAIANESSRDRPSLLYLRCCLEKAMIVVARALARGGQCVQQAAVHRDFRKAFERIEECIAQCQPFRVAALADEMGMSADHFSRVFRQATGATPMDYFQRRRIQHASWLLLNAQHSITDVAHVLGFCDSAHFSRFFKRQVGMSPSVYRKQHVLS